MTAQEKHLLRTLPLYTAVFLVAILALEAFAGGMDVYVEFAVAGGVVAVLALVLEARHTRREIEHRGEDFQQTVRDLDEAMSKRDRG